MNYSIKFIFPEDCYPIRQEILRKGLPESSTRFAEDFLPGSFHLGFYYDTNLAGIVSCYDKKFIHNPEKEAFQLRGMAVLESYRNKSIAFQLCSRIEEIARVFKKEIIWCNARTTAVGLYDKLGYEKIGEEFSIPSAGPHFLMFKYI